MRSAEPWEQGTYEYAAVRFVAVTCDVGDSEEGGDRHYQRHCLTMVLHRAEAPAGRAGAGVFSLSFSCSLFLFVCHGLSASLTHCARTQFPGVQFQITWKPFFRKCRLALSIVLSLCCGAFLSLSLSVLLSFPPVCH